MCGIAGAWNGRDITTGMADAGIACIARRGPDGRGVYRSETTGSLLLHTRLAILDPCERGAQPMANGRGQVIVFNGEIYNFRELRADLLARGHAFRSESDTEVILAAYTEWGADAFARLRGIYALAILDEPARTLVLARDRVGVKPLFLETGGAGRFGSTLDSLIALGAPARLSRRGLQSYLLLRFVPSIEPVYDGIRTVLPGEVLEVSDAGIRRLVAPFLPLPAHSAPSKAGGQEAFRALVKANVIEQTVSDVPIGLLLSSGIDSTAVGACLVERGIDFTAFTLDYDDGAGADSQTSEAAVAREIARGWGVRHEVDIITADDVAPLVETVPAAIDLPFGGPGLLSYDRLSRFVSRSVKVALGGDGPDEVFGGYRRHRLAQWPPSLMRVAAIAAAAGGMAVRPHHPAPLRHGVRRLQEIAGRGRTRVDGFPQAPWLSVFSRDMERRLFTGPIRPDWSWWDDARASGVYTPPMDDPINAMLATEVRLELVDNVLTKADRASGTHGLEVRVPLLADDVLAFAFGIDGAEKVGRSSGKKYFREAVAPWLPRGIAGRGKRGFAPPVGHWFRHGLGDALMERAAGRALRDIVGIDVPALRAAVADHKSGARDYGYQLWALHALAVWLEARPSVAGPD